MISYQKQIGLSMTILQKILLAEEWMKMVASHDVLWYNNIIKMREYRLSRTAR